MPHVSANCSNHRFALAATGEVEEVELALRKAPELDRSNGMTSDVLEIIEKAKCASLDAKP